MSQEIVRCPYCVLGSEFRPMFSRGGKSYVCVSCGHTASSGERYVKCTCARCRKLQQIANRLLDVHAPIDPARTA